LLECRLFLVEEVVVCKKIHLSKHRRVFYNKKTPKPPLIRCAAFFGRPPYEFPLIHVVTYQHPSPTSTHSSHIFPAQNPYKITLFQPKSLPYSLHCQKTFPHTQAALILSYIATKQKRDIRLT